MVLTDRSPQCSDFVQLQIHFCRAPASGSMRARDPFSELASQALGGAPSLLAKRERVLDAIDTAAGAGILDSMDAKPIPHVKLLFGVGSAQSRRRNQSITKRVTDSLWRKALVFGGSRTRRCPEIREPETLSAHDPLPDTQIRSRWPAPGVHP
jgi:hypothetical protein